MSIAAVVPKGVSYSDSIRDEHGSGARHISRPERTLLERK